MVAQTPAACANEALKLATQMAGPLQNYMMYTGGAGIYSYTFEYERKETCPACGSNLLRLSMPASATLEQLIERLMSDSTMYVHAWKRRVWTLARAHPCFWGVAWTAPGK